MGLQRGEQEVEVGGVGQQVFVHPQIVRHLTVGLEPDVAHRILHRRANRVDQGHRAHLDGLLTEDLVPQEAGIRFS